MGYKLIFEEWLNSEFLSVDEKLKIQEYSEEEKKLLFNNNKFSFGTAGIRRKIGIAPQLLNIHTYKLLAIGYLKYLKTVSDKPKILIAHDNRKNGDKFAWKIASVMRNNDIEVYLPPNNIYMPTPVLSYYIRKLNLTGGINITASHNPPDYNGFKTYNSTGSQTNANEEKIILENIPPIENIFKLRFDPCFDFKYLPENFMNSYFEELIRHIPKKTLSPKKIKVLFSSHHGTSSNNMLNLASKAGFENFIEFPKECTITSEINADEITNPEEISSFNESIKYAEKINFQYICAHDPDSDRAAVIEKQDDGSWYCFNGNEMGLIFTHYLIQNLENLKNSYIVSTYVTGDLIKKLIPSHIPIIRVKTGFKNIAQEVEKNQKLGKNLLIAYEEAIGALLFPINRDKDGYQQTLLTLEIIAKCAEKKMKLTDLLNQIYQKTGAWIGTTDFYLIKHNNWKQMIKEYLENLKNHEITNLFNFQIKSIKFNELSDALEWTMNEDSWIKFRTSGTENKLKIYYNLYGNKMDELKNALEMFRKYFKEYLKL